ncbi:MAG TPA: LysM peptidoglycan-binding domain-containing protein [Jatrophihabitans sp.]|jgi:hypothetical protein
MTLEKAYLLHEDNSTKIPCLFNPESISVSRSNSWEGPKQPGKTVPQLGYKGAQSATMNLSLIFDTTDVGTTVTAYTDKVMKLMDIDPNISGSNTDTANARPPTVSFHWGDLHSFPAVINSANLSFTYFSSSGVPLRATIELGLTQFKDAASFASQNPTSGTPRPHRVHRVQPGETLDRISARYYGDSTKWRALASANGIEDPLALRPGSLLSVPQLGAS